MDRNLPDNHRFRLNEDVTSNTDGKLHLFVKLTDSCMQKIETYMKQNTKMNLSTIKFNLHGGVRNISFHFIDLCFFSKKGINNSNQY